jgi:hypothetical protein
MLKRVPLTLAFAALTVSSIAIPIHAQSSRTGQQTPEQQQASQAHAKAQDLFLPQVLEMNAEEAEIGDLIASRAQNNRLKNFGRMLATYHHGVVDGLGGLYHTGTRNGMTRTDQTRQKPSGSHMSMDLDKDHADLLNRLTDLSGAAFDREAVNVLIRNHQDEISFLESRLKLFQTAWPSQGSNTAARPDVKTGFIALTQRLLGVARDHLRQAQSIQKDVEPK